jgi:hypothetical protein
MEADMELNEPGRPRRTGARGRIAALLAGAVLLVGAGTPTRPCCFTNPRYSGVCAVEPGEGESCRSILDYLNNPQSQGKTYCGNTNVRGGWTQVTCEK